MAHHPFALFISRNRFRLFIFSVGFLFVAGLVAAFWKPGKTSAAVAPAAPLMSGCTTPSFGAATNFAVGTAPKSIAVGDFNRDGKPDLATANPNSTNISVLLGNGAGSFGAANNIGLVDAPQSIATGDFNRDGNLDLAVANPVGDDVSVLLGNGAGGFGAPVAFGTGQNPSFVAVGDFNRDGNLDLATTNQLSDNVSVLLGNGAGNFGAATNFGVGTQPVSVVVGDVNLDGISDLVVANLNSDNVSVLLGDSGGALGAAMNFAVGDGPSSVAMGDFNLDGKPDLAVVLQTPNSVAVLLGNGAGTFGAPVNFGVGSLPLSIAVGDANLDGRPDLIVGNAISNSVSVLLGNGAGSFGTATHFNTATRPEFVAVSDFNLDGKLDLAAANNTSNNVSVLLNICNGTPCIATNFGAATNFNAGTQPNSVVNGDFNQDGSLDLAVANVATNNVSVYLGNGAGNFGAATNFTVGTQPLAVTAGDFNLDGNLDLATANSQSANISILLGNGLGSFGAATNFAFSNQPASIAVADFNRDGKPDIVTANANGNNVTVYQGDGMGSFGPGEPYSAGNGAFGVAVGDFNLDGKADVAVANLLSNNVSVLLGNGMGGLGAATNFAVGNGPGFVQVGDFNQDGKPDLAVANTLNPSTTVSVLLGNGAGSFGAATNFTVGAEPFGLAIGDYNRDGKPDIATANGGGGTVSVILGNGAGSFGAATNFAVGTTPQGLAAGDFNRDGKTDLVVTNYNSNNITVRLNACVSNTPPNLNVLGPLTISQGSNNNLNIALATDPDQANNTLILSVTPLTGSGVSYTGFSSGIGGTNAAIVRASCTATNSTFQMTVTDNQGAMVSGVQTVNVTPNTAPTLGQYGNTALTFGQNTTVIPNAVPADNGTVNTLTATAPGFTGTFNANVTTGVVTVTNAGPIGSHTVTVTATDNCGTTSTRTFALTVTSPMTTGCATPSFGGATNFAAGSQPVSVAAGDFNLDGKPDLVVANGAANNVSVFLGNGTGSFGAATNFAAGTQPRGVAVGDFNLDGKPDLAVANNLTTLTLLLGNGAGGFGAPTNFTVGFGQVSVAVGDFNLDGKPDLVTANGGNSNVSVLLGNGAGSFGAATNFATGTNANFVAVGDFNLDGKPDLVTANPGSDNVSVLLGNGAGSFGAASNFTVGTNPWGVAVGDFNSDGSPDLAVANLNSANVSVLLGNGAGSFGAATNFATGTTPRFVTVGDFNQDGKTDLATANDNAVSSNNVSVLLGNGAGSFGAATNFLAGNRPTALAVGDFNLDGRPDLSVANFGSGDASVLLNTCNGTPCSGTSFAGATNFTAGTTPRSVAVGDFNLDGKSDLAVANNGTNNVSILIGNGVGNFGAATNFAAGTLAISVAVGDFNLDGKPDLAVANFNSDNVSILLGTGSGSFGAATNFATGARPDSIAVGDFNNDGKSDLATANFNSNNVSVLLGNGSGGFGAATNFAVGIGRPQSVVVGDFNRDGKSDLATANETTNNVSILLGDGSGSFGAATNFAVGTSPETIVAGDFNRDGKSDLATANFLSNNVSILLGDGSGSFGAATNLAAGIQPTSIAVGDFNRDGKSDLATKNAGNIAILPGDGSGGFGAAINFPVPAGIRSIQVGDFNLDGRPDLATANTFNNNVSVLLSNCFSSAQTITVNTTADTIAADGFCSLREAITAANTNTPINECPSGAPGLDNISFALGAGTPTISIASPLPTITEPITIDGSTGGATRIEINGGNQGVNVNGLTLTGGNSIIRSLVINRFTGDGIAIQTNGGNTIQNCLLGVNAGGTALLANKNGVTVVLANGNTIGGTAALARNIIAGGDNGVAIVGNGTLGANNVIQANYIGTDVTGIVPLSVGAGSGIFLQDAPNNTIGGTTAAARNIIGGWANGVSLLGNTMASFVAGNVIAGNFIGLGADVTTPIANTGMGVEITSAAGVTVGGTAAGAGNVIAYSTLSGVTMGGAGTINNRVLGNFIYANGGIGIDLGGNGVTANDAGDGDTGPNNLQNFPVISSAVISGGMASIQGTLNSTPGTLFRIEFFSNASCDASGNGEGQIYLGFANVATSDGGNASFSVELPVNLALGQVVTVTATDPAGNTSEFSPCGCTFTLSPTQAGFSANGGNGGVNLTTGGGCSWVAVSNAPWINVTGGSSGSGNGLITYTVAANPANRPRTGSISIAGFTFYVTQAAGGLLLNEDFSGGIPNDWTVVDGGTGNLSWEDDNPCNVVPGPPFVPPFVIVDLTCAANDVIPDESLITPPFDASGLSQVILQFDSWFKFTPGGLNVVGDVDVSTNGGVIWMNVLRLQGANENPTTKTLDITAAVSSNPANVRVRFHYYTVGPNPGRPTSPRGQELSWGIDRPTILALSLGPVDSPLFPAAGDTGNVTVTVPEGFAWTAQSNNPWITPATGGGTGIGTLGYTVAAYAGACQRAGGITISLQGTGLNPAPKATHQVTQSGTGLAISPATLPNGFIGASYSQTLTPSGGTAPYTCSLNSGSLPPGVALSGCTLSGTPSANGSFNFTVAVTDANSCAGTRAYTLTVSGNGLQFYPLPQPVRLLETRAGFTGCTTPGAAINAGSTFTLPARTTCAGIPAGAQAVTGNITVVPTGGGFLTLFPSSAQQPTVANSNFGPGEVTNNVFTVGLGAADGAFKIFASGTTHVIVDVTGYYAPPAAGGLYFHPLATPVRLLETRAGLNGCIAPGAQLIGTGDPNADPNIDLAVQGRSPVASPCNSIPSTAQVLVGNATSVVPSNGGFLTIYPSGGTRPLIASSNYGGNDVINGPF
ncbi:MAG TPA: FG-GAP-like repeat-containing protein, partial [Blastocatellia bacterium]|nr:FG-GAP-like repeat-containing protein [Blastocatellia bacterium]